MDTLHGESFLRAFCFSFFKVINSVRTWRILNVASVVIATLLLIFGFSAAAEDIEIYVGDKSYREGQKPQVLIIFDNSGSMRTTQYVKPDYNPALDYRTFGARDPNSLGSKLYFVVGMSVDTPLPNPDSTGSAQWIDSSFVACAASQGKLREIGYFTGHLKEYQFSGNAGSWRELSSSSSHSSIYLADCWEDILAEDQNNLSARLPDGNPAPVGYPVDGLGSAQNPTYFSTDLNLVSSTFGAGPVTTLYTENYLRWYHATNLGTVPKSRLDIAKQTMVELLESAPALDFGLMVFNLNAFSEYQRDGGRVVSKIGSNNTNIINTIKDIDAETNTPLCESLYEAYRYFSGQAVLFGAADRDASWWSGGRYVRYYANDPPRDSNAEKTSGVYLSPFDTSVQDGNATFKQCANNVNVILITDGTPTRDKAANSRVLSLFPTATTTSDSYLASLAQWMHTNDIYGDSSDGEQHATTYTIGFGRDAIDRAGALLEKTAEVGGGQYFPAEDAVSLQRALQVALSDILKVSSSFTTPTVASNNFDRTRSLDSVYYSMFLPAQGPRWSGNIKKLKMVSNVLTDAKGQPAVNDEGVIRSSARTFWTDINEGDDGNDVEKGGVVSMLRQKANRIRYTDIGTGSPLPTFSYESLRSAYGGDAQLASTLGVETSQVENYVRWAMGIDVDDSDSDGSTLDNRIDIFGDPLHSRPAVINYGPADSPDIRLIVGTNAGVLHMFADRGDTVDESWSFMPSMLFNKIKALKENFPGTDKVYGIDGTPVVYLRDLDNDGHIEASDGDKAWVFVGMRRGGNRYFAFDVSQPDIPRLMWQISPSDTGFTELGQTWSTPRLAFIKGHQAANGSAAPVLIFGAGYDPSNDNPGKMVDNQGRGFFIVDAETKRLLWSVSPNAGSSINKNMPEITESFAAPLTPLDSDFDGFVDRIYSADVGGNVWRTDLVGTDKANWRMSLFASLGGTDNNDRRFFSEPVVARSFYEQVTIKQVNAERQVYRRQRPFDAVLLGSGNRAHPAGLGVNDALFMLQDWQILPLEVGDPSITPIQMNALFDSTADPFFSVTDQQGFEEQEALLSGYNGWYYRLASGSEKSLSASLVLGGVAYFTSFIPADSVQSNQCLLNAGSGQLYAFNLNYGSRIFQQTSIDIGDRIPDTLELFLDEDEKGASKLLLIGVGAGENATGVIAPPVACVGGAECLQQKQNCQQTGNCSAQAGALGIKTTRTYLYVEEDADEQ